MARLVAPESGTSDGNGLARTPVLALYDHEEVGSESATGAAGMFLASLLERIATAQGASRGEYLASLHRSIVVSADGAHATHPNYVERHEPSHRIALNKGVVVKRNANQRYATDATSEAFVVDVCREADVPLQYYIHRNDLPCGSTIGPITAARLAVPTVDIGAPQLAMHSARETAGLADVGYLEATLHAAWRHGS
jgi:aspartyl aminopeptidase